jgi:hypothetical protein
VFINKVGYIDYEKDLMDGPTHIAIPFFYKRKSFEFERELRVAGLRIPKVGGGTISLPGPEDETDLDLDRASPNHVGIKFDLNKLIEKVYVCPFAEEWFEELVISVTEKYGLNKTIKRSDMKKDPIY